MDPNVISLPYLLRRFLVWTILQSRPQNSANAYASIWTDAGSPLLVNCKRFAAQLRTRLDLPVAIGMRYGKPSYEDARKELKHVDEILVVSPYPQYAAATVQSMINHAVSTFSDARLLVNLPYYNDPRFIGSQLEQIKRYTKPEVEHFVFSFHGIPVRQLRQTDPTGRHCLRTSMCCEVQSNAHSTCYRHQCLVTARALGEHIDVPYSISFQSRLGRAKWLTPYSSEHVRELALERGFKHIAVACPAFTVDNLETLYEVEQELRDTFVAAGGKSLTLIPCVNELASWLERVVEWCNAPADQLQHIN